MQSAADIEVQLWEYIDNVCDEATRERITGLIATDKLWAQKYSELLAFNNDLQALEPEHTSMRFSKNVMEAIADVKPAKATNSYVNPAIIKGIAAICLLIIGTLITYALVNLNWKETNTKEGFDYGRIFNSNFTMYAILLNILILMVFIDTLLRRKRTQKT